MELKINVPEKVLQLKQALGKNADLHLVGGCIRDIIMNTNPKDFDLATALPPEVVIRYCKEAGIQTIETGIRRGTITAVIDHEPFEITTFRKKGLETEFSNTIEEDLSARDFTINAIAYSLDNEKIVDPYNGIDDIKNSRLVSVGAPEERFEEDPHRIIRMCRFAAKYEFFIPVETGFAAEKLGHLMKNIEPERINAELKKIFDSLGHDSLLDCLLLLEDVGFFKYWIPELEACKGVEQNKYHSFDVYTHIMHVVRGCHLYHAKFAALFHDIAKPQCKTTDENGNIHFYGHEDVGAEMTESILRRLKFSNSDIDIIVKLVKFHMRPIDCGKKAIRKLKSTLGSDWDFELWMDLKHADKFSGGTPAEELLKYTIAWNDFVDLCEEVDIEEIQNPTSRLAINGYQVMSVLNLKPGPQIGEWMKKIQDYVFEFPEKNTVEDLTGFIIAVACREETAALRQEKI